MADVKSVIVMTKKQPNRRVNMRAIKSPRKLGTISKSVIQGVVRQAPPNRARVFLQYQCVECGSWDLTPINKRKLNKDEDVCEFVCEDCGKQTGTVVYAKAKNFISSYE